MLGKKRPYSDLRRVVVIFITEHDVIIGDGLTLYTAEFRVNETGRPLSVDVCILYVNNEIQDPSTELGRLMYDSCAEVDKIYSELLVVRTRKFKNTWKGWSVMSTIWKKTQKETAKQATEQANEATAIRMLKAGKLAMEEIADYFALSLVAVQNLVKAVSIGTM